MLLRLKLHMKQFSPNEVTDEGIMIDVKLLHNIVSATHCVPVCFDLNGRKVIAWILWMGKMMKN